MVTRSQVLAVSSARLLLPTTRKISPLPSNSYKVWVSIRFNFGLEKKSIGERMSRQVEKQHIRSLGLSL